VITLVFIYLFFKQLSFFFEHEFFFKFFLNLLLEFSNFSALIPHDFDCALALKDIYIHTHIYIHYIYMCVYMIVPCL
jgi:hypothetical protein